MLWGVIIGNICAECPREVSTAQVLLFSRRDRRRNVGMRFILSEAGTDPPPRPLHRTRSSTTKQYLHGSFLLTVDENSSATPVPVLNSELIKVHSQAQGPNVSVFYKDDGGVVATSGSGCTISGPDGDYLDCANNVAGCGHSHSKVVAAGQEELGRIQTNGRFLHPTRSRYLKKLLDTLPDELDTFYFTNSGSEANDLALRMAKQVRRIGSELGGRGASERRQERTASGVKVVRS